MLEGIPNRAKLSGSARSGANRNQQTIEPQRSRTYQGDMLKTEISASATSSFDGELVLKLLS